MKKTLQDIVKETGYSLTTVSRAINNPKKVSPDVRSVILNCAREIGYLKGKRTVMLIVPQLALGFYYYEMLKELSSLLDFAGFRCEAVSLRNLELVEEQNICAAISIMAEDGLERYWGTKQAIPLVCINTRPKHLDGIFTVSSNERQGMQFLCEQLIKQGHRRILLVSNYSDSDSDLNYCNRFREKVFIEVMKKHDISDYWLCPRHWTDKDYELVIRQIVETCPTAVICTEEGGAAHLLYKLNLMGLKIPEDISLTGWINKETDRFCNPPITGIMHNYNFIAQNAFFMLQKLLDSEPVTEDITLDYNFYPGASIARRVQS